MPKVTVYKGATRTVTEVPDPEPTETKATKK